VQLLFGKDHPGGQVDTVESVEKLTLDDAKAFYQALDPRSATFVVVGDTDLNTVKALLEARFGDWKSPQKTLPAPKLDQYQSAKPGIYIVDKPGAGQSMIMAGTVVPALNPATEASINATNTVLGAGFMSRLNMNLREDKHWAYGAGGFVLGTKGPRAYAAYAPVQTDKTKESVAEVYKELHDILGARPVTATELADAKRQLTNSLPGEMETGIAVTEKLRAMLTQDLPKDYFATFAQKVESVSLVDSVQAAKTIIKPEQTIYVVVGDRLKIEAGLNELSKAWGLGPVTVLPEVK